MKAKNREADPRLVVFTRCPDSRAAKSRLRRSGLIPAPLVQSIHRAFVHDTLDLARNCGLPVSVAWHPVAPLKLSNRYPEFLHMSQRGQSFSARIRSTLVSIPQDESCILIGSDCPYLNQDVINSAAKEIQSGKVVIGPVPDCGFYLLGLPATVTARDFSKCFAKPDQVRALQEVFSDCTYKLLPELADIDEVPELEQFCRWLAARTGTECSPVSRCNSFSKVLPELLECFQKGHSSMSAKRNRFVALPD